MEDQDPNSNSRPASEAGDSAPRSPAENRSVKPQVTPSQRSSSTNAPAQAASGRSHPGAAKSAEVVKAKPLPSGVGKEPIVMAKPIVSAGKLSADNALGDAAGRPGSPPEGNVHRAQPVAKRAIKPSDSPVVATASSKAADDETPDMLDGDAESHEGAFVDPRRRRLWLSAVPSWLFSLLVHLALILILAMITLDPVRNVVSILQASTSAEETSVEEFDLQGPSLDVSEAADPLMTEAPVASEMVTAPEVTSPMMSSFDANVEALDVNAITESIIPSSLLKSSSLAQMSSALNSRSSASRGELLERYGGTAASEKAVAMGLKWIAAHQARDGGWTFVHNSVCRNPSCPNPGDMDLARNGATAMALLPFLGAGQTHVEGQYKQTVYRGLEYLINRMQVTTSPTMPMGSWHEPGGRMYSHSLAAITVCEAYAMTKDPDLLQPAQLSLNYLIQAQNQSDGGWRYKPGDRGDTSVVGWCLMALKSGRMGNLIVPPRTFQGTDQFLDFVSTNNGAYYGYTKPTANLEGREATTAVGLLCRMYLGYPKEHPGLQEGIEFLSKRGPKLNNLYYSYYATQVMRHHGGEVWEKWNSRMRDQLVKAQVADGHAAGSWYESGGHSGPGGRLYCTSLATMILEVYYRHMPLYSERSSADDFEL